MVPRGEIVDAKTICGLHLTAAATRGDAVKVGLTGFSGSGKTTVFSALDGPAAGPGRPARADRDHQGARSRASTSSPACTRRRR